MMQKGAIGRVLGFRFRLALLFSAYATAMALAFIVATTQAIRAGSLASPNAVITGGDSERSAGQIRTELVTFSIVAAGVFSVLGWLLAVRVTRPLQDLANTARHIEQGESVPPIPQVSAGDEFGVLARALTSLVSLHVTHERELKAQAVALQQQLADRTEELSREMDRLERASGSDTLTGLANRRQFNDVLEREWQRAIRYQLPLSLVLGDIDHFKLYNDHYGHQGGDECLQRVGAALAQTGARAGDLAARYGGEEFAVILTHTDEASALRAAERLLGTIRHYRIPHKPSPVADHVTLSLGVASVIPNETSSPADLIRLADTALYQAKDQGRNRVVVALVEPDPADPLNGAS